MLVHGGRKREKKNRSLKNKVRRGGCGGCVLSPASLTDDVSTLPASEPYSNSAKMPNAFSSSQVGGGYGYTDTADAAIYAGSYATPSKICTAGNGDPSRGGNNFMSGGKRMSGGSFKRHNAMRRKGGSRKTKKGGKRSSKKGGKRSSKKGGSQKKWKQRGCMKGGVGVI